MRGFEWRADARDGVWLLGLGYAAAVCAELLRRGQPLPWELAAVAALSAAGLRWRSRRFWVEVLLPFALLLLAYRGLSGFARGLRPEQINIFNLIAWERALCFGVIPSAWLQARLFDRGWTIVLDAVCNLLYLSHFVAPVAAAAWIRSRRPTHFGRYLLGFFLLAYLGFATYLMFPAAPPWWATRFGYLAGPDAVSLEHFIIPPETMFKTPNPLAAMPSMHCAYPLFIALSALSLWGRRALRWLLLPAGVGFAVVYLGHHYVVDVVAGYLYAAAVWLAVFGCRGPQPATSTP